MSYASAQSKTYQNFDIKFRKYYSIEYSWSRKLPLWQQKFLLIAEKEFHVNSMKDKVIFTQITQNVEAQRKNR